MIWFNPNLLLGYTDIHRTGKQTISETAIFQLLNKKCTPLLSFKNIKKKEEHKFGEIITQAGHTNFAFVVFPLPC